MCAVSIGGRIDTVENEKWSTLRLLRTVQLGVRDPVISLLSLPCLLRSGVQFVDCIPTLSMSRGTDVMAWKPRHLIYLHLYADVSRARRYTRSSVCCFLGQSNRRHCSAVPFSTAPQPSIATAAAGAGAGAAAAAPLHRCACCIARIVVWTHLTFNKHERPGHPIACPDANRVILLIR
jgi:hypothetical protein